MAGFRDMGTLGITRLICSDEGIDHSSGWYRAGVATPIIIGTAGAGLLPAGFGVGGQTTTIFGYPAIFGVSPALASEIAVVEGQVENARRAVTIAEEVQAEFAAERNLEGFIATGRLLSRYDQRLAQLLEILRFWRGL